MIHKFLGRLGLFENDPLFLPLPPLIDLFRISSAGLISSTARSMELLAKIPTDFLDSAVLLEQIQYEEGFKDGYKDGVVYGKEEGREVGLKHGFQVGEELGFYHGCVEVWKSAIRIDPNSFSSRVRKRIDRLLELVEKYPLFRPENENVQEMMDDIRLNFKIISTNLGVKLEYEGQSNTSKRDLEEI